MKKTNWAIIAPGNIARTFSKALQGVESARLYSVASRSANKAEAFAKDMGFDTFAESQEELLADPLVDIVYIASPHVFHADTAIECLQAGKAVLCEKPMAINSSEAERVFQTAKQHHTFYMEAVWTRFMPVLHQVLRWIQEGQIGEVKMVQASFGISKPFAPSHRLYDLKLAGGALLDVGIYPITFAQMIMQKVPEQILASANIGQSGVDESNAVTLKYPGGAIASVNSAISTQTSHEAWVYGSKGKIKIPTFWHPQEAFLFTDSGEERHSTAHKVNGYEYEIEEVQRCLLHGLIESPEMTWQHSKIVLTIMDEVRKQIGLRYPHEHPLI